MPVVVVLDLGGSENLQHNYEYTTNKYVSLVASGTYDHLVTRRIVPDNGKSETVSPLRSGDFGIFATICSFNLDSGQPRRRAMRRVASITGPCPSAINTSRSYPRRLSRNAMAVASPQEIKLRIDSHSPGFIGEFLQSLRDLILRQGLDVQPCNMPYRSSMYTYSRSPPRSSRSKGSGSAPCLGNEAGISIKMVLQQNLWERLCQSAK